jgi:death-on-curing protein
VPAWLGSDEVIHFHRLMIGEYGGLEGPADLNALESTLARPMNRLQYDSDISLASLAACYGYGLTQNHCFPDGNKRIALVCINVFLEINGSELVASEVDAAHTIWEVAAGAISEEDLAVWITANMPSL